MAGKADEAVGLSPGNEDNAASCPRCPEKPCCLLYTEGTVCCANRFAVSVRLLPHNAGKSAILSYCLHSDIIAMRIFTGALRRTSKRCKGFGDLPPKNLAPEQRQSAWKAGAFKACGFVPRTA